ncbi:allophanate hydrolase [Rhizobacter sp. AJA081-3]|uniref:allophanate hydrolase n=1 Tax=Rhizobacter sp. AJA081-3 TaxID=2753607 RepID=UPI001AE06E11|nr:allophanate hydrolase [Rhizobacter sp. AJA081-3]QTN23101.1 allophanate hydrolase [Rhizobacter sp. AJA081-3]
MARFLLNPCLYTSRCTETVIPTPVTPLTLPDWLQAYRDGASPAALLGSLRGRLAARTHDVAVIRLISDAELQARLAALDAAAAKHADRAALLAALPLFGVPFAVKDNIDIAGIETTAACPAFAHRAERSATVVQRLEAAGAVWIAKTNLDQFATGLVGTRSPYGRPASALAPERISGGSSAGSAVLVARGDVPFSLGTDTAGSGRVPAGFNQIVGLKPTPGRTSTAGVVPACRSLDCVSIFAQTVDDAAGVLAVIEGADPADAYSRFAPGPAAYAPALSIGVPAQPEFFGDAAYVSAWPSALERLGSLGHRVVPIDFSPLHEVAALLYDGPWVAERHAAVRTLLARQPEAFDDTVRRVISRALDMSATDAFVAQYRLRELALQAAAVWAGCDVLMVPTTTGHPRFADIDADPIGLNSQLGRYTNFVNLLDWCAIAVPSGTTTAHLPFGVTFIAPPRHDAALARFARGWQAAAALPMGAASRVPSLPAATPTLWPRHERLLPIAVVGAHLSGLPLNGQLIERGATLIEATTTAPRYRLHALPGTVPPKPGLVRDEAAGHAIALEVWAMPQSAVGSFLALIPAPLGLGSIELADGRRVHGFLCEAHAVAAAPDVSGFGGWRAYLASLH